MALLVAAMMSTSVSASAGGRRGECRRGCKGDFRKEIRFQCNCPRCMEFRRMETARMFDMRDPRFFDRRFARGCDKRFDGYKGDFHRFDGRKGHKHGKRRR